ncbi:unnamed protein product [Psylliodes chrysocephalus]|uniref:Meiosis-specific nuclear structural protein 1 n=1 Tax=Psylliodes chrysocephalus TaxID=3402493 RepID=A0A9P0CK08_9CUCU|nr:unnamed protein product [Psylliodes chrysocephala]
MYDGLDHSPRKEVKAPGEEEVTKFDDGQSSQIKDTGNFKDMDPDDYQSKVIDHVTYKNRNRNFERYCHTQRRECEEMTNRLKVAEHYAMKERQLQEGNDLARELEAIKREEFKEHKLRQQLRENAPELRDLERKLKAAYVNKALAAQIAQKEAVKLNEKIHDAQCYDAMTKAWVTEKEHNNHLKQKDMIKKAEYKKDLQEQLIMREKSKRYLYEEYLREKKLIDDVIKRIHDEDEKAAEEKWCRMKRTQKEIVAFKKAQEKWKKKRMDEIEEENRRIEEYLLEISTRQDVRAQEEAKKQAEKEKLLDKMALDVAKMREAKKERDAIIQELKEEELRLKQENRYKDELKKKLKLKLEAKSGLMDQMKEVEEKRKRDQEEEKKYKEEILAKMIEDEKLEQLSAQRKRLKLIQMRKDVEKLLEERRAKHAEEFQLQIAIEEEVNREAERRDKIIEEERVKMLQEHVQHLSGYLPKGLLRPEDLPYLSPDIIQGFKSNSNPSYIPPVHRKR